MAKVLADAAGTKASTLLDVVEAQILHTLLPLSKFTGKESELMKKSKLVLKVSSAKVLSGKHLRQALGGMSWFQIPRPPP